MKSIDITIDGQKYSATKDSLLIDLLIKNDLKVPYFCYHEVLRADGNCRMCMVEIEGQKRPQIACDTLIKDDMVIKTKGEMIDDVHRDILELELINHPVDCPVCDQAGECKLQDFYMDYGLYDSKIDMADKVKHKKHIDLGSSVILDQERCVLCARCTRFTSNVTKTHELGIIGRGDEARVSTMPGKKLENPYAMNVVDLCPVGALTSKDFRFAQRVWFLTSTPSICQGCAKGCNIYIDHNRLKYKDEKIYRFRPRQNDDINGHFICDEGRLSYKLLHEKRQESIVVAGKEATLGEVLGRYDALVESSKNIVIIADANLYREELEMIISYAKSIGAKLYIPMDSYIDEKFGDDWLRSSQRASNAKAVEILSIADKIPDEKISLLIDFNHPDIGDIDADSVISFRTHSYSGKSDILLPLASYIESSGTIINEDGIEQYSSKVMNTKEPIATISKWLSILDRANIGGEV